MRIKRNIPNLITASNLVAGCIGIVFALKGEYVASAICIWIAALFDFLDGFVARLLKVHSEIGKQLDSLADMVTFGALPGFIVFHMLTVASNESYLPYIAFLIPVLSAFRLAKFNLDERQTDSFIGMPTPANALFFSSLIFLQDLEIYHYIFNPIFLVAAVFLLSFLLIAEIPMLALKFKSFSIKENFYKYFLVLCSVVLLIILQQKAFSFIIVIYLIISFIKVAFSGKQL